MMNTKLPEGLTEKLASLGQKYAASLPGKLTDIERAVGDAPEDPEALETAKRLAHRLHGTAGAYGFGDIGRCAGVLENALNTAPSPNWTSVRTALQALMSLTPKA